ncbi:MAG: ATP-binding cassette domain-containing protein, partial [Alphaproteobacteria bacterium]|nr:ATP-binding cassette domain-containing protein [Alphaproteobacteria bacterium]
MLQVTNLVCGYGDIIAIHQMDLTVANGGTLALVGPNGAGKTTLIMSLA